MQKLNHFVFIISTLLLVFVLGSCTPPTTDTPKPNPGETVGDVTIAAPTQPITTTDPFTTEIYVNTGTMKLAAYTFKITYDPNVLDVDTSYGSNGASSPINTLVVISNPGISGQLTVTGFDVNGVTPSNKLDFLNVGWKAKASGTTTIKIEVTILSDETTKTIGKPQGYETTIKVSL